MLMCIINNHHTCYLSTHANDVELHWIKYKEVIFFWKWGEGFSNTMIQQLI